MKPIMKKILSKSKNFIHSFSIRVAGLFFQFLLSILVARFLGTAGSGIYSIYTSWFNLLSNFIALGLPQFCIRNVSILFTHQKYIEIQNFIRHSFKIFSITGFLFISVFYLFGEEIAHKIAGGETQGYILKLSAVAATAFIFLKFLSEILKSINRLNTAMLIESLILPLMLVVSLYFINISSVIDKSTFFLITHIVIMVVLSYVSWLTCQKSLKSADQSADQEHTPTVRMKTLIPFWLSSILGMWFLSMPLLISPIFSTLHETGVFSAAYRLITIIVNVLMVLSGIYGPRFARNYNSKNYAQLYHDLKITAYISMACFAPLFVVFIFYPTEILGIFGPDFTEGASWLQIMALGQLVYSATGLVGLMMNMIHKEKLELALMSISAAVMLTMMLMLGYLHGMTGIAIAFACGLAFKNLISLFFVRKMLKNLISETA